VGSGVVEMVAMAVEQVVMAVMVVMW